MLCRTQTLNSSLGKLGSFHYRNISCRISTLEQIVIYKFMYTHTNTNIPPDQLLASACRFSPQGHFQGVLRISHTAHRFSINSCATPFPITAITGCGIDVYLYGNACMGNLTKKKCGCGISNIVS